MECLTWESWILMVIVVSVFGLYKVWKMKRDEREDGDEREEGYVIPRGSWGWPFIGETLEFIASGYTSKPVSFMEKRKSL